jgi:hypothetical protein
MAFQDFEVFIEHFQGRNVGIFQWNKFKLDNFPEFDDTIDLLFHLSFVFGNLTQFFDGFLVIKKSQVPQEVEFKVFVDFELLLESVLDFGPVSLIGSDHGLVLEISDHGDEDAPSLDFLTDTKESAALSVIDLDRLQSLSHFFDLILHLIYVHLSPFELHVIRETFLTFFYVLP